MEYRWEITTEPDEDNGTLSDGYMLTTKLSIPAYGKGYYPLGKRVQLNEWNSSFSTVVGKNAEEYNNLINEVEKGIDVVSNYHTKLKTVFYGADVLIDKYKEWVKGTDINDHVYKSVSFKDVFEEYTTYKSWTKKNSSYRIYSAAMKYLGFYLNRTYELNTSEFSISDFKLHDIFKLETLMKTMEGYSTVGNKPLNINSIQKYFQKIQTLLSMAVKRDYIATSPFDKYDVDSLLSKTVTTLSDMDRRISAKNVKLLMDKAPWPNDNYANSHLRRIRLLMILQLNTGMSYIDLVNFNAQKNIKRLNGSKKRWIVYNRQKTSTLSIVPLFKEAKDAMSDLDYKLLPPSHKSYNEGIITVFKAVGVPVEIAEEITSHDLRHVFGSYMLEKGFSMAAVSRMMGHKSVRTTEEIYAKINDVKIMSDLERNNIEIEINEDESLPYELELVETLNEVDNEESSD